MTQIFFPNLVASEYVLLPGTIRAFSVQGVLYIGC